MFFFKQCTYANFVRTITQQPLEGIQLNFTEVITSMPSCACSKELLFGLIFKELWPFVFFKQCTYANFVRTITQQQVRTMSVNHFGGIHYLNSWL